MKILIPYMVETLISNPILEVGTVWIGTNDANTEEEWEACISHYRALHEALSAWAKEENKNDDIRALIDWIQKRGLTKYNIGSNGTPSGIIHRYYDEYEQKNLHIAMSLRKRKEQAKDWTDREVIIHQLRGFQASWDQVTSGGYFSGNLVNIHHSPDTFLSTWSNPSWLTLDEFMILLDMAKKTNFIQAKIDFFQVWEIKYMHWWAHQTLDVACLVEI